MSNDNPLVAFNAVDLATRAATKGHADLGRHVERESLKLLLTNGVAAAVDTTAAANEPAPAWVRLLAEYIEMKFAAQREENEREFNELHEALADLSDEIAPAKLPEPTIGGLFGLGGAAQSPPVVPQMTREEAQRIVQVLLSKTDDGAA